MVNRFRASIREEATTGGSSSSATQQASFLRPWRPERLPLSQLNTDSLLRLVWKRGPREGSALTREAPTLRPRGGALQIGEPQSRGGY